MKFRHLVAPLLIALALPAWAQDSKDIVFTAARDAFRNGDAVRLERSVAVIGQHPLAAYAENYLLRNRLARNDPRGIAEFLARNSDSYVAEKLRADWLRWAGKQAEWALIDAEYPRLLAPDTEASCLAQQARWAQGDTRALDAAAGLWLTLLDPPEGCRPLLDALVTARRIDVDAVWARARLQLEANRQGALRRTLDYLPSSQTPAPRDLDRAIKNAMSFLAHLPDQWQTSRSQRELAAIAIQRLASSDPLVAARELERRRDLLQPAEMEWAWSQIAQQAARRHLPVAAGWYARAGTTILSDEGHQWKVRAALRAQDWGSVRDAIEAMPAELAGRPEWIYWLARAFQAGGRTSEAEALFRRIAGQPNFYGNLADEDLGQPVTPPPGATPPTADEMRQARDNVALQRALAFFRLDMRTEGVREWNWALRGMSDRQLLAAAALARRHQIWDRAINTADRTQSEHDYSLRFLAPYSDQVRPAARQQSLDDAWVYGLMRQESRFITSARSTVGASGLMQLMPATAKWVARKIGLRDYHPRRVNETEVNILLGTSYMRLVMENLDNHPVLASAAYNAGPSRAKRWRGEQALEGAIYAETIPFSETRDYVKKVMSNAVYYSALFNGKPDSLKRRLGIITPPGGQAAKDADLP